MGRKKQEADEKVLHSLSTSVISKWASTCRRSRPLLSINNEILVIANLSCPCVPSSLPPPSTPDPGLPFTSFLICSEPPAIPNMKAQKIDIPISYCFLLPVCPRVLCADSSVLHRLPLCERNRFLQSYFLAPGSHKANTSEIISLCV